MSSRKYEEHQRARMKRRDEYEGMDLWVLNVLRNLKRDSTVLQIVKEIDEKEATPTTVQLSLDLLLSEEQPFVVKSGAKHYRYQAEIR